MKGNDINMIKTYRELLRELEKMEKENNEWMDTLITVELSAGKFGVTGSTVPQRNECFPAELRLCSEIHDSLCDGYPVIFVDGENTIKDLDIIDESFLAIHGENIIKDLGIVELEL